MNQSFAPLDALRAQPLNPLAGQTLSGAEILVQVLVDEGVEVIFGYSGGAILPTYDAVFVHNHADAPVGDGKKGGKQPE